MAKESKPPDETRHNRGSKTGSDNRKTPANGKNGNTNGNGKPVTDDDRAALWAAWQVTPVERQLERQVINGRRFGRRTIHRVRVADDWDGRAERIHDSSLEQADRKAAGDRANLIAATRGLVTAAVRKLWNEELKTLTAEPSVTDFVTLGKFQLLLEGDPTERMRVEVTEAAQQLTDIFREALRETVKDAAEREACLAAVLGGLGRLRYSGRAFRGTEG